MNVLITGICGFVGSVLAKAWREAAPDVSIFGLDNLSRQGSETNRILLQKHGVVICHGDLRLTSDVEALPPVDWVIDAAANPCVLSGVDAHTSSRQLMEHNLIGTVNLLEYCKRYRAGCILLSSSRVYSSSALAAVAVEPREAAFHLAHGQVLPRGLSASGLREEFSTAPPLSLYGSSKLSSEILALEYGEAFDFPVWINRCGLMAGAGQFGRADQGIVAYWINAWLRRQPLTYLGFGGRGYQVRDCLHPRDLLPLIHRQIAAGNASGSRVFNLGGGTTHAFSLSNLSRWCENRYGQHAVGHDPQQRRFDIPWLVMDASLAKEVWGWSPRTSLEEIFTEIALHAESNPDWLELSGSSKAT